MCIRDRAAGGRGVLIEVAAAEVGVSHDGLAAGFVESDLLLSLIHISEPTRPY